MCKDVIIIGAGGHGSVIADIIKKSGDNVFGFLDDDLTRVGVIGKTDEFEKHNDKYFIIAIGDNNTRRKIAVKMQGAKFHTAIHPKAVIGENVTFGEGTVVMANAVINSNSRIGNHCIINTASVIEHDNIINNYAHISPGATLCGTVTIGELTHIGAGAVIKNNITVCDEVTVGIGGVVIKNITESGTYVGIPCRKLDR